MRLLVTPGEGAPRELRIDPSEADPEVLGAPGPVGAPVAIELPAPSGGALTVAVLAGRAALSVAQREDGPAAGATEEGVEQDSEASAPRSFGARPPTAELLAAIERASARLFLAPSGGDYLARARALAWLGQLERARRDLERAGASGAAPYDLAEVEALRTAQAGAAHLVAAGAPPGVLPLWPPELAVAADRPAERAEARRIPGLEAAGSWREAALALGVLARTAARDEAGGAALLSASLRDWGRALAREEARSDDAPLLFGLARSAAMRSEGSRLAEVRSARRSAWQAIGPTGSGGYERVALLTREAPSEPEQLAAALLGAGPTSDAFVVWPGQRIELRGRAAISRLTLRCGEPAAEEGRADGCPFSLRRGDGPAEEIVVASGVARALELPAGVRRVEVALADAAAAPGLLDAEAGGAERFRSQVLGHLASAAEPVAFEVLGPSTLELELRGLDGAAVAELRVGGGTRRVALPAEAVPAEILPHRAARLGARRLVTLPLEASGLVAVTVSAPEGEVLVRARLRVPRARSRAPEASDGVPPDPVAALVPAPPAEPVRPAPAFSALTELPAPGAAGTFSFEAGWLTHDVSDADNAARASSYLGLTLGHRIALVPERLWLRTEVQARLRLELEPAFGARVTLEADLGLGLRARLLGGLDVGPAEGDASFRAQLVIDRPIELGARVTLLPRASLFAYHATAGDLVNPTTVDFEVWSLYRRDHPLQLTPGLALRWDPATDARLELAPALALNSDFASIDRLDVPLSFAFVTDLAAPRALVVRLGYRPGYRFQDRHRRFGYLRHDVSVELEQHLIVEAGLRFVVGLAGTLFVQESGLDAMAFLTVRLDLLDGRGVTDFAPSESFLAGVVAAPEPLLPRSR